jgi:hypothetical protein
MLGGEVLHLRAPATMLVGVEALDLLRRRRAGGRGGGGCVCAGSGGGDRPGRHHALPPDPRQVGDEVDPQDPSRVRPPAAAGDVAACRWPHQNSTRRLLRSR